VDPTAAAAAGVLPLALRGDAIGGPNGIGTGFSIPPWTATIGAEYKFPLFKEQGFIRLDYTYAAADKWTHASLEGTPSSPLVVGPAGVPDTPYQPRTSTYDPASFAQGRQSFATLRVGANIGDWVLSLFCDNLTDSHTITNFNHQTNPYAYVDDGTGTGNLINSGALQATASYRYITYRPRTFGITVSLRR
jgi:hypothetical protein